MERIGGRSHQGGPTTTLTTAPMHSMTLGDSFLASDIAERNCSRHGHTARTSSLAGLTLAAVLNIERSRSSPTSHGNATTTTSSTENDSAIVRTLLDTLQNEQALIPGSANGSGKKTWKSLKDRLKLRRLPVNVGSSSSSASSSSNPVLNCTSSRPVSGSSLGVPNQGQGHLLSDQGSLGSLLVETATAAGNRLTTTDNSGPTESNRGGSMRLSAALAAEREETRRRLPLQSGGLLAGVDGDEGSRGHPGSVHRCSSVNEREGNPSGSGEPVRMSLMDLLEDTDLRVDGDEEDEVEEQSGGGDGGQVPCCVCLVRHKGAAFIPCGHTFCRLCSRELWVQRGHCPLCNNFIVEILDIF